MALPQSVDGEYIATANDYWSLPEGKRAELIDGALYDMAPPGLTHQMLVSELTWAFQSFTKSHKGSCVVLPAPFAVNLDGNDTTWVEPDILVVCDPSKLSERACEGAPDFVVEVVSPSSQRMDYLTKADRYARAGVREYWIVDPMARRTAVYRYEQGDVLPTTYAFNEPVSVGIWNGELAVTIADLLA